MANFYELPLANDFPYFVVNSSGASVPASGYKLFLYQSSTNTKIISYTDSTGGTQNSNPLVLGSTGLPQSGSNVVGIWLAQGQTVKAVFAPSTDTDPPSSPIWTRDFGANPPGINDPTGNVLVNSEWTLFATAPTFVSSTSFTVAGDQRSIFQIDRRVKSTNSGGTIYSTISNSTFGSSVTTVTVVNDAGVLDSGISSVSYALLSGQNRSTPPVGTVKDQTDPSKVVNFNFNNISTGTTRSISLVPSDPVCDGRLTLTTGTAITTTDVTAATSIFFTPYKGNRIATYSGTNWTVSNFTEKTLAVPASTSQMYDVFIVDATLALEALAWTNDTTRATALTTQDGILVKTGDATRRYLGSFRTTGSSGQTEDSIAKRYVWNYYNRVIRKMLVQETTTSWTYALAAFRQANASATNQLDMVIGVRENIVSARVITSLTSAASTNQGIVGIGIDATNANSADLFSLVTTQVANVWTPATAYYVGYPGIGRHFLAWVESSPSTATMSFNGNQSSTHSGISGELLS